ncbi:MAG: hypothetical protein AAFO94_14075, partial [Bacteroidota bacterium]
MKILLSLFVTLLLFFSAARWAQPESVTSPTAAKSADLAKAAPWNPAAGVIAPISEGARIIASSNQATAAKVLDGNAQTHWISDAPLPEAFLNRRDLNCLRSLSQNEVQTTSKLQNWPQAVDGNSYTEALVGEAGQSSAVTLNFPATSSLHMVALKVGRMEAPVEITAILPDGRRQSVGNYLPADLDNLMRFPSTYFQGDHVQG